ncbi:MAG: glycosyltransferase family 4 protein [Chitinispirillales bacterium]|jgi:glycosyltransferase involved in cell wall biosynthesis|nr:glycosyltransferase family 4 protein [Chitinispirillales bacterium]
MKILILNWRDMEHPEAGGAEVHFAEIFSRLANNGHAVTLLTTRFKGCEDDTVYRGIEVLRRGNNFVFNWEAPSIIKKLLKTGRSYDCIIDDVNKLPFFSNRRFPSIPCGVFFHHLFGKTVFGLTNPPMALYVYLMEKLCGRGYRKIECCAVSPSTAEELVKIGFDESKLTVIENGIDTGRYCIDKTVKREDDLLIYVGRLKKYKRVDNIFEAMSILEKKGRKLRLAVVGTGDDLPRLKKRARELGVDGRVDFAGFVNEDEKIKLLRKAAIFVNPSEKEGWGITNIEAAACGTPVVANNAPGLRDSVVNNETGLLYNENDVQSLVYSLQKLLDDGGLRKNFAACGRRWAEKFSWDASAQKVEQWLQKIVKHGK